MRGGIADYEMFRARIGAFASGTRTPVRGTGQQRRFLARRSSVRACGRRVITLDVAHARSTTRGPIERAARDATVQWILGARSWDTFVTLTFAVHVSESLARDALLAWLRDVAVTADHHVAFTYVMGPQPESGRPHFHVLLSFEGREPTMKLAQDAWKRSRFPAGRYDAIPYAGAEHLVKKHLDYMLDGRHPEWEPPNFACPRTGECKRRHRCVVATTGWK